MKRLLYISGAPRVSLDARTSNQAARNHILSVMEGFKRKGYPTSKYIFGDYLPKSFHTEQAADQLASSNTTKILADLFRVFCGFFNQIVVVLLYVWRVDFTYERFGAFQAGGMLLRLLGKPWILETNAILYEESSKESKTVLLKNLAKWMEGWAYRNCTVLVCISSSLKDSIADHFGIPKDKILVSRNGVDPTFFNGDKCEEKPEDQPLNIGYVGSLAAWQNLSKLVDAIGMLDSELQKQVRCTIIGDGPFMKELVASAKEKGLSDLVDFKGQVPLKEVPQHLCQFDVGYCYPEHKSDLASDTFNSPMKLYEYFSMGKPAICKINEDIKRMNHYEQFTYDVSGKSLDGLIAEVLQNKSQLRAQGLIARKEIVESHSWDARIEAMLEGIRKIGPKI